MSEQNAVLAALPGGKLHRVVHFSLGNAFAATVSPAQAAALAANPAVASVIADSSVQVTAAPTKASTAEPAPLGTAIAPSTNLTFTDPYAVCPSNPAQPLVEPEGLASVHAIASGNDLGAQSIATGTGVKVAILADGLDPKAPDFMRANGTSVISDYQDFTGDGPNATTTGGEAMGDASTIASQGLISHDLSNFVNEDHPLPAGCNIRILGMAPGASIVALKVIGTTFQATTSAIIQALNYAVTVDHVDVINESLGGYGFPDSGSQNVVALFNEQAVAAGVSVIASTGDAGVKGTIGSPAADPSVISAAATTDYRLYQQVGQIGTSLSNKHWLNNNIAAFSSGGITMSGGTPTLAAPGDSGWAACSTSTSPTLTECVNFKNTPQPTDIEVFGGTSQAAPFIAGAAALVIQAYRASHAGASPTPALVKQLLAGTARNLGLPSTEQGAGLLDARAAVEAAKQVSLAAGHTAPASYTPHLLASPGQILFQGKPGALRSSKVTLTNTGSTPLTVSPTLRHLVQVGATQAHTITLSSDTTTGKTLPGLRGGKVAYKTVPFTVAPNMDRLEVSAAYHACPDPCVPILSAFGGVTSPDVTLVLLAPDGSYVADSRPQGPLDSGDYGTVDVAAPAPGTWTAVLAARPSSSGVAFNGPVKVAAVQQRWANTGSVSAAALIVPANGSASVTVHATIPSSGGDSVDTLAFGSAGSYPSIPVVLRTLLATGAVTASFTGDITGGNGRAGAPAQTFNYGFTVGAGHRDLDVSIQQSVPLNPLAYTNLLTGVLIDPDGEVRSIETNVDLGQATQLYVAQPMPGTWHLVVVVPNSVTGDNLNVPFLGTIAVDKIVVDRGTLPNDPATKLAPATPTTVTVQYTNTGNAPEKIQADPRTTTLTSMALIPTVGSSPDLTVPASGLSSIVPPTYLVPPMTRSLTLQASSTVPVLVTAAGPGGGTIIGGTSFAGDLHTAQAGGTVSTVTTSHPDGDPVTQGDWNVLAGGVGPFSGPVCQLASQTGCIPSGTATTSATATTPGFDTAITSSTGDMYRQTATDQGTGDTAPVVSPGQTVTITLTVTPNQPLGTVVHGVLNIVTVGASDQVSKLDGWQTTGDVLASLPYTYTVGI